LRIEWKFDCCPDSVTKPMASADSPVVRMIWTWARLEQMKRFIEAKVDGFYSRILAVSEIRDEVLRARRK